jgi:ubiquinone/menaquinone biosynthesis C-methylase UbiE
MEVLQEVFRCPQHPWGQPLAAVAGEKLRCSHCGHTYPVRDGIPDLVVTQGSEQEFLEAEAQQWDEHAPRYEEQRTRDAIYMAGLEAAAGALAPQAPALVLDAGCGTGLTIRHYLRPGLRVVGLDVSLQSLRQLRQTTPLDAVVPVRADLAHLPFTEAAFDGVLCANTLQHIPTAEQRRRCIDELTRVVRPGGRIVVTAHSFSIPKQRAQWCKEGTAGSPSGSVRYIYRYEAAEFQALLGAGLQVERVFGAGLPLPYRWKLSPLSRVLERSLRRFSASAHWGNLLVGVCHKR